MHVLNNPRRKFLKNTTFAGLATAIAPQLILNSVKSEFKGKRKQDHLIFLFQGDSITDGNRGRNNDPNHVMGHGYAFSIASRVGARFPEKALTFHNRGISGNTITDLNSRWEKDALDMKPDVLSILIGINDTELALKQKETEATKNFEQGYRSLLNQTKTQFPNCLIVLCEPFIASVGRVKENWNSWQSEIEKKQEVVQRLSIEYQTVFVPLQNVFKEATTRAAADYWVWDGIHPTVAGHELITQQWLKQVSRQLPFLKKV